MRCLDRSWMITGDVGSTPPELETVRAQCRKRLTFRVLRSASTACHVSSPVRSYRQ